MFNSFAGLGDSLWRIRRRTVQLLTCALASAALAFCQAPGQVLNGYFQGQNIYANASNGQAPYFPNRLDSQHSNGASRLTYLIYAFADIQNNACALNDTWGETQLPYDQPSMAVMGQTDSDANSGVTLEGTFHQLQLLKQYNPNLKILISIGGSSAGAAFQTAASPENVSSFVGSCVNLFINGEFGFSKNYPGIFDGVDIDWEFPGPILSGSNTTTDQQNYVALLKEFRTKLGPNAILTAASGVSLNQYQLTSNSQMQTLLAQMSPSLNYFNVMAYDYNYAATTGFNAPLFPSPALLANGGTNNDTVTPNNADASLQIYTGAGIYPTKLVLGIPFYGKQWTGVTDSNDGLFQPGSGLNYIYYSQINTALPKFCDSGSGSATCPSTWGSPLAAVPTAGAQETWVFDGSTFTSFDDAGSIAAKVKYAQTHELAGVLVWDVTMDDAKETLLTTLMNDMQTPRTIFVGGNTSVWGVSTNTYLYKYNTASSSWSNTAGIATDISIGYDGDAWAVTKNNQVYHYVSGVWQRESGTLAQIVVGNGAANDVWGLTGTGAVYKWSGSSWVSMAGVLVQMAVGNDGATWGVTNQEQVWHYTGSGWLHETGTFGQMAVGNANAVFGLTIAGITEKWNGSAWTELTGATLSQISVGMDGDAWGVTKAGQIYHCPVGGTTWTHVSGALQQISVGSSSNVWGVTSAGVVYQYVSAVWQKRSGTL